MKRTHSDERQEVYTVGDRTYSIVDLRVFPDGFAGMDITDDLRAAYKGIMMTANRYPYEVADITKGIDIIGRFSSGEEAIEFVRHYNDSDPNEKGI